MRVPDKMMTRTYREASRYAALTILITGGVLLGDVLSGGTVSLSHAIVLLIFTAALCASGIIIKAIWSRRSHRRSKSN